MLRFDEAASQYDLERTAMGYRIRHALVRSLLLEVGMHSNLALDIGCGTGEYTILMERMGFYSNWSRFFKSNVTNSEIERKSHISDQLQLVRSECSRLPFKEACLTLLSAYLCSTQYRFIISS